MRGEREYGWMGPRGSIFLFLGQVTDTTFGMRVLIVSFCLPGNHNSIAVAFWSTGSSMDMITGDFARFVARKPVNASIMKA